MNLHSDFPYWLLKNGIINSYPSISKNLQCDVVIVGAGISGALVAWHLGNAGIKVILVDKRHVGTGSTAASTALLQYEIDVPLHQLIKKVGEYNAVQSYTLCLQAIKKLENICKVAAPQAGYVNKPSFQYASTIGDVEALEVEYHCRKNFGFDVQWQDKKQVENKFGFSKAGGILSAAGAQVDAYLFTHQVLAYCIKNYAAQVYDNTAVQAIHKNKSKYNILLANGSNINCKNVVIAAGYESQGYLTEKVEQLYATFAIVSEPLLQKKMWYKNALIWETADPYLYLRTTQDNRVLIGGKDVPYTSAIARDKLLAKKIKSLEKSFIDLFPHIPFKTDFSWAGTFAGTKDGLPYIGENKEHKGMYFALGFGGNGITFSVIAGQLITEILMGKKNKQLSIFKFSR